MGRFAMGPRRSHFLILLAALLLSLCVEVRGRRHWREARNWRENLNARNIYRRWKREPLAIASADEDEEAGEFARHVVVRAKCD